MIIKSIISKIEFKVSFFSGIAALIKIITAVVLNKIISIWYGPLGVALLGQMSNFISIISSFSNFGINNGIIKYVSEFKEDKILFDKYVTNANSIAIVSSMLFSLVIIGFSKFISIWILGSGEYSFVIFLTGVFLILFSLNTVLLSVVNGFKHYETYIRLNIITNIFVFLFTLVLLFTFGMVGALLAVSISHSLLFFVNVFIISKKYKWILKSHYRINFNKEITVNYLKFSIMTIITSSLMPTAQLLLRKIIITKISIDQAGIWEGINKISLMIYLIIGTTISTYFLPRLSEINSSSLIKRTILNMYKIVLPILTIGVFVMLVFKRTFIELLFSPDFNDMKQLFVPQLIGDIMRSGSWLMSIVLIAKARTKLFMLLESLVTFLYLFSSILLMNFFGILGISWAYFLSYLIYWIILWVVIWKKFLIEELNYKNDKNSFI